MRRCNSAVEFLVANENVMGSNPIICSTLRRRTLTGRCGDPQKFMVRSSNLLDGTKISYNVIQCFAGHPVELKVRYIYQLEIKHEFDEGVF